SAPPGRHLADRSRRKHPVATKQNRLNWIGNVAAAAILIGALAPFAPQIIERAGQASWSGPDWALWARLPWVIQLHIVSALSALAIGIVILLSPKGRGMHKPLGWGWVFAMATTAVSSLFITGLNGGL